MDCDCDIRDAINRRSLPGMPVAHRFDFASPTQVLVKVRVRIVAMVFVDHLTWHRIDGKWLITSKGFHVESDDSQT